MSPKDDTADARSREKHFLSTLPADGNTLWQASGVRRCASSDLHEIAHYEKLANVRVLMRTTRSWASGRMLGGSVMNTQRNDVRGSSNQGGSRCNQPASPLANRSSGESKMREMRSRPFNCWPLVAGVLLVATSFSWAQSPSRAVVVKATKHAFAPPLGQMESIPAPSGPMSSLNDDDDKLLIHSPRATRPAPIRPFRDRTKRLLTPLCPRSPRIRG